MQNQEESLLYGLRLLIRVLGVLLLFNIVNGVGTVVNEYKNSRQPNVEVQVDTCIIHDTVFVEKPILQKLAVTDTLRLPVLTRDTLMLHDTVLVHLPIEQRQYGDPRYTAWVSGYRPHLDSIHIYQRTEYITKEIKMVTKPKRWGIGLQAGYGVSLHKGQVFPAPYIGVGLSYSIFSW